MRISQTRRRVHRHPIKPPVVRPLDIVPKVIVFGYLRGGTTFLGNVLGVREGTFYLYEPLFDFGNFIYFKSKKTCQMTKNTCRNTRKYKSITQVLDTMFRCEFMDVQRHLRLWQFNKGHGEIKMEAPKECKYLHGGTLPCLRLQVQRCWNATTRVFKIARTDLGLLLKSLSKHPNTKIVHLIRDPRAIIYSRFSLWSDEYKNVKEAASALCSKMLQDYQTSRTVSSNMLKTVVLERFVQDPISHAKKIFDFVGYTYSGSDEKEILEMTSSKKKIPQPDRVWSTVKSNSYLATQEWRKHISQDMIESIENECRDIFSVFNYKTFRTNSDLRNITLQPVW